MNFVKRGTQFCLRQSNLTASRIHFTPPNIKLADIFYRSELNRVSGTIRFLMKSMTLEIRSQIPEVSSNQNINLSQNSTL